MGDLLGMKFLKALNDGKERIAAIRATEEPVAVWDQQCQIRHDLSSKSFIFAEE
jgi:hypothetical protein